MLEQYALQSVVFRVGVRCDTKESRPDFSLKHLIVHLSIIFCTGIEQVINLLFFFFDLDCIHVKCIYIRKKKSFEVQNPKEYLRYKYKYILNNNLYHA